MSLVTLYVCIARSVRIQTSWRSATGNRAGEAQQILQTGRGTPPFRADLLSPEVSALTTPSTFRSFLNLEGVFLFVDCVGGVGWGGSATSG